VANYCLVRTASARRSLAFLVLAGVPLLAIAELDGVEPDFVLAQNLDHRVGRCFHHGARDLLSLFVEDLGHAQLLADDTDHFFLY
jgi:hypothetical protein